MEVLEIGLGHRDPELGVHAVDESLHHTTLVLEGTGGRKVQLQDGDRDDHGFLTARGR
jgi:hypothetical protein